MLVAFYCPIASSSSLANEQDVEVIANPHDNNRACAIDASLMLEPYYLIAKEMTTQKDTSLGITYSKVMTVPIPVYQMKQPARLSSAEFDFSLVLVKELSESSRAVMDIEEIPEAMERARDSWFPGYYWSPLVVSCPAEKEEEATWRHVGWKFTALNEGGENEASAVGLPHFYALMVKFDKKESIGIRIGGFRAPGWMIDRIGTQ